jgi:predicted transposase YbfD/YdcC
VWYSGSARPAEKSNEKTAIPELLATLALEGSIVTIDAMGTQPNIAQAIRDRGADYLLAVKDNQPKLAESIDDFFIAFEAAPAKTPHQFHEVVEKDHGRIEVRRCYVFNQLDCLHAPERWPDLTSFVVITTERTIRGKATSTERRVYLSSLPPDAQRLNQSVRLHWRVENSLHWCMDVVFGDDQMLGVDIRDGFQLAVKLNGGKLGGLPAEVVVGDDQFKPEVAKQLFERYVKRDKVDFMTGVVFSNIMLAALPEALDNKVIYISPNAAPSSIAGKDCNPRFFAVSWPNDAYHEAAGAFANQRELKNAYLLAPNYQAGKDSLAGFKRTFKGQVVAETYTKLGQLDYAAELAEIRAAKPQALYIFLPGGMGINFIKQFVGAGLSKDIMLLLPGFSADQDVINPVGPAMLGPVQHRALVARPGQRRQPEVRGRVPEGIQARAHAVRVAGLRRGAADQRRGARREGQARRPGRGAQGAARRQVRVGARGLPVQQEPVPDPELLRAHRGQRRQGRPDQQVLQRAHPEGPRRRLRRPVHHAAVSARGPHCADAGAHRRAGRLSSLLSSSRRSTACSSD